MCDRQSRDRNAADKGNGNCRYRDIPWPPCQRQRLAGRAGAPQTPLAAAGLRAPGLRSPGLSSCWAKGSLGSGLAHREQVLAMLSAQLWPPCPSTSPLATSLELGAAGAQWQQKRTQGPPVPAPVPPGRCSPGEHPQQRQAGPVRSTRHRQPGPARLWHTLLPQQARASSWCQGCPEPRGHRG